MLLSQLFFYHAHVLDKLLLLIQNLNLTKQWDTVFLM